MNQMTIGVKPDMTEHFELCITDVSEIEAVELQNEIEQHLQAPCAVELSSEPLPHVNFAGDPGLAHAALTYGPQIATTLAAALAAWVAAGKKRKVTQARRIVITRNGILYSNIRISDLQQEGSGKTLEAALTKLLEVGDNEPGKAAQS